MREMLNNRQTLKIVATCLLALVISFLIYLSIIYTYVDPYLEEETIIPLIFNFYDYRVGYNANCMFFIGNSQVLYDITASIIECNLHNSSNESPEYQVYNLGVGGDDLLRRVTELNYLIKSRPKTVIIGLSYRDFDHGILPNKDRLVLSPIGILEDPDGISIEGRKLFDENHLEILDQNYISRMLYKRKFLLSGIYYPGLKIRQQRNYSRDYFRTHKMFQPRNLTDTELMKQLQDPEMRFEWNAWRLGDDNHSLSDQQKKALMYIVKKLKENSIQVAVFNMPINPLLSVTISNVTRKHYFSFLNDTGVVYYDFERKYPSYCFRDMVHMNEIGSIGFSNDCSIIIREMEKKNGV